MPAGTVVAGNPARVIRHIEYADLDSSGLGLTDATQGAETVMKEEQ